MRETKFVFGALVGSLAVLVAACGASEPESSNSTPADTAEASATAPIQILAINDFHGRLQAEEGMTVTFEGDDIDAGGAAYLAAHLQQARADQAHSTSVAAGDLIGGAPFLSSAFDHEPTVESMGALGLEVSSVGNHEFDKGIDELLRIVDGGCGPDGCKLPNHEFAGADFRFLAANVVDTNSGEPVLDPTWVKDFGDDVRIGFIGMTLADTPDLVAASGIEGLEFLDEVETANKYAEELSDEGVNAIVVLLHEGGYPEADDNGDLACNTFNGDTGISGPIVNIAEQLDPRIDIIVTGHTHQEYVCSIPDPEGTPRLVTSAESYGRVYTDIRADYDLETGDIVRAGVEGSNIVVDRLIAPDPDQVELIDRYNEYVGAIGDLVVGFAAEDIMRGQTRAEEFPLGNLIADVHLARTSTPETGGAQIAFMNPGGVRDDLLFGDNGAITYEALFQTQPFGNSLVTMDLTGEQILEALRQQWEGRPDNPLILQVSEGFTYSIEQSRDGADKLVTDSVRLDGEPLQLAETYRVTVNSFLADGGDGFTAFADGTNRLTGETDLDAFGEWLDANTSPEAPVSAPKVGRITVE
ncbi:bifunctional metallophosphatase/5'-nucleotidase [Hoyosella rhizosphaerae]|uniref:5'-nucleotidase n=1 Tax=Hoyosella rhizosphaerae TaxID=1755582 RepID=A0A916UA33_9ACTN|nr:bifunctional metallophosphatase/5'-nucleotidase [Hoyosella rhizosphaerae]MBN4927548.1 bifunctional metallophosphatase/5'-nucleotidase [Hoyosella rhizosphaerae]GGC63599.1 5'-nucleotidase [Hoyosella rhizosphaerae]